MSFLTYILAYLCQETPTSFKLMTAEILDGKSVALHYETQLKHAIEQKKLSRSPGLAVILVGDDPASALYVTRKHKACEKMGFYSETYHLAETTTEAQLLQLIDTLNASDKIDGILVQLPLPQHIQKQHIIERISPQKDVDGFHPYNFGRLAQGHPTLRPCTPYGVMMLLEYYKIDVAQKNALIIGASTIVGRPMALELLHKKATPTICHRSTKDLQSHVDKTDILIVAAGQQDVIAVDWLKPHQIVIDVGIHRLENGKIRGDVHFEKAKEIVKAITPVPFGIGPMTICMLLHNTAQAYWDAHRG